MILQTPITAFEPSLELTNFPYGVLDVGYVYVLLENMMKNI
jgi:hypothetical protein